MKRESVLPDGGRGQAPSTADGVRGGLLRRTVFIAALAGFTWWCAKPPPPVGPLPQLNYACFVRLVEPELEKSCAFSQCHGAETRPLRVFSMSGVRGPYGPEDVFLSDAEHQANYRRALVYAAPTSSELPDLLRKPLQLEAGGSGHGGVDRFGKNVFASKDDEGWRALETWVNGGPGCELGGTGGGGGGAGGGSGGGMVGPTCDTRPSAPNDWDTIKQYVNPTTCADDVSCHTRENMRDAGCFLPDSCDTVRASGCVIRSVRPCNPLGSILWRYSGWQKNHNNKFPPRVPGVLDITEIIGEWIDAGASCDGGGPWP